MKQLEYPLDNNYILKKKRSLKRTLLADGQERIHKKIAVLGGSTTDDIISVLELFLLDNGFECEFYNSEYNKFWEDAVFGNKDLDAFSPDLIIFHTSVRNITDFPNPTMTQKQTKELLNNQYNYFVKAYDSAKKRYNCPIIANNFELPTTRFFGNLSAYNPRGTVNFVTKLNVMLYDYAQNHDGFYIHDINYLSAVYGLDRWSDTKFWHLYKYAMNFEAIPDYAFSLCNIIKAVFGKSKKAIVLDLDNTLWGGVVGDDGVNGIEIGQETPMSQVYSEFQGYIAGLKKQGIILTISSKNDEQNALAGLAHPESILHADDFAIIKANWENKDKSILEIANELNILPESMVFADDNPAERELVKSVFSLPCPEFENPCDYIKLIERGGYFESVGISEDDLKRNKMYAENRKRNEILNSCANYEDYLKSLEMQAEIKPFCDVYISRIAQLTNKSNQFNLTTKRYTLSEIEKISNSPNFITLYGKLSDKFGDNGVVSVVIGEIDGDNLDIRLWLMSCRVLKRGMEYAMLDQLVKTAKEHNISALTGYYFKTAKNKMVENLYADFGFKLISEQNGDKIFKLNIKEYYPKNHIIKLKTE